MKIVRGVGWAVAVSSVLGIAAAPGVSAPAVAPAVMQRDGSIKMAGRDLRCGSVRNRLDLQLPSEGAAAPGVLVINPRLIARMPQVARLFVFYHECGHHNVGNGELAADCWAVERGVREGWLDRSGLGQICRAFGDMPATATHPSGESRCRNLDRCYASAQARGSRQATRAGRTGPAGTNVLAGNGAPALVSGPELVGTGTARAEDLEIMGSQRGSFAGSGAGR